MKKFDTVLKAENLEIAVKTNRLLLTAKTPEIMFNKASIVDEILSNDKSIFQQSRDEFGIFGFNFSAEKKDSSRFLKI